MNRKEYLAFHRQKCNEMIETTTRKNNDYAGHGGDDPFANFRLVDKMNIASVEIGFLTRMTDKISRINSFAQGGKLLVRDESVTDTLIDLANYAILFAGYLESERRALKEDPAQLSIDSDALGIPYDYNEDIHRETRIIKGMAGIKADEPIPSSYGDLCITRKKKNQHAGEDPDNII